MRTIKYLFTVVTVACAAVCVNAQNLVSVAKYGPYNNLSIQVSQIDSMTVDAEGNITVTYLDKSYTTLRDYLRLYIGEESATGESMNIIRWMVNSDRLLGSDASLNLHHYAVTEMPEADLTLFLPSDNAFKYIYDPMSFTSFNIARVMRLLYTGTGKFPFKNGSSTSSRYQTDENGNRWYVCSNYNVNTGAIGTDQTLRHVTQAEIVNRMRSMLLNHCIFNTYGNSVESGSNEYFKTIGGAPVKVIRDNGKIVKVLGGFQLENEREIQDATSASQGVMCCNITEEQAMANGQSYILDSPIIPASRSVWSLLANVPRGFNGSKQSEAEGAAENNPYQKFYELCDHPGIDVDKIIKKSGLVDESKYTNTSQLNAAIARYSIFTDDNGLDYNLSFLKSGDFTLFVPSNEAVTKAIDEGLPTWESIMEDYEDCYMDGDGNLTMEQDSIRIQSKIIALNTFIKSHFMFGTAFADQEWGGHEDRCPIVFADGHKNFIYANCKGNGKMEVSSGHLSANVIDEVNGRQVKNIFVSEYHCSNPVRKAYSLIGVTIDSESYGTVHLIDGILNNDFKQLYQY